MTHALGRQSSRSAIALATPAPNQTALEWLPLSHWQQPLPRQSTGLEKLPGGLAKTLAPLASAREDRFHLQQFAQVGRQFDELAGTYVAQAFARLGWQPKTGETFEVNALAAKCAVMPTVSRMG